jgi:hypothetical protein
MSRTQLNLAGTIERRVLVNYRADPDVIRPHLPAGFEPQLHNGNTIVGICLIQLRVRPAGAPRWSGIRSFNGAHRFAVTDPDGRPAVYIPRRDTNFSLVALVGGRLFPGVHERATTEAIDDGERISIMLASRDAATKVAVRATYAGELPAVSVFANVGAASDFFERADIGYSESRSKARLDCLQLCAPDWSVTPLSVEDVTSSFFDDRNRFPAGSVTIDHALLMRNIAHSWHRRPALDL